MSSFPPLLRSNVKSHFNIIRYDWPIASTTCVRLSNLSQRSQTQLSREQAWKILSALKTNISRFEQLRSSASDQTLIGRLYLSKLFSSAFKTSQQQLGLERTV